MARLFWVNYIRFLDQRPDYRLRWDGAVCSRACCGGYTSIVRRLLLSPIRRLPSSFSSSACGVSSRRLCRGLWGLAGLHLVNCKHQYYVLETGGDESSFAYDFSQATLTGPRPTTTGLARRSRNSSCWQRWQQPAPPRNSSARPKPREHDERLWTSSWRRFPLRVGVAPEDERRFMTLLDATRRIDALDFKPSLSASDGLKPTTRRGARVWLKSRKSTQWLIHRKNPLTLRDFALIPPSDDPARARSNLRGRVLSLLRFAPSTPALEYGRICSAREEQSRNLTSLPSFALTAPRRGTSF